jgi:hypothetical protein
MVRPQLKVTFRGQRRHFIIPNSKGGPLNMGETVKMLDI